MFFIVNHENSIIGTDALFLHAVGAKNLIDASELITNGKIELNKYTGTISYSGNSSTYKKTKLITCLGEVTLYQFDTKSDTLETQGVRESVGIVLGSSDDTLKISNNKKEQKNIESAKSEKILELISKNKKHSSSYAEPSSKDNKLEFEDSLDILSLIDDDDEYMTEPTITKNETPLEDDNINIDELNKSIESSTIEDEPLPIEEDVAKEEALTVVDEVIEDDTIDIDELNKSIESSVAEDEPLFILEDDIEEEPLHLEVKEETQVKEEIKESKETQEEAISIVDETVEDEIDPYDELLNLTDIEKNDDKVVEDEAKKEVLDFDDLISLKDEDDSDSDGSLEMNIEEEKEKAPIEMAMEESTITIGDEKSDEVTMNIEEESEVDKQSKAVEDKTEYNINVSEVADLIGIPNHEYVHFLNDFFEESKNFENDLRGNDLMASKEASSSLKEASSLLQLPHLLKKLDELDNATSSEKNAIIDEYMSMISRTHAEENTEEDISSESIVEPEGLLEEEEFDLIDDEIASTDEIAQTDFIDDSTIEFEEEKIPAQEAPKEVESVNVVDSPAVEGKTEHIDLDTVTAIPFDFSIREAAEELTLPESLIAEFVVDFIDQAKENLPILEDAYRAKDMDKIEKTAHLLKGASSNLRIVPMAETLLELQTNLELERVPELINMFVGQLKSLINQMK